MIDFLIKSTVSLAVLLLVYRLLLEHEKMHRFNRFYLLFSLVFSMVLPFIIIPVYVAAPKTAVDTQMDENTFETVSTVAPLPEVNYWPYVLITLYSIVAVVLSIRYIYNIRQFYKLKRHNVNKLYREANLVLLESNVLPHTFLQNIFLSKKAFEQEAIEEDLLLHELTHVRQKHTLDILFTETLTVLLWFNPLLYFYKKAIQLNHEFLADESVLHTRQDALHYQELLLQTAATPYTVSLASNLNFSITKKRFTMMTKTTHPAKAFVLQALLLPTFLLLITLSCTQEVVAQETDISSIPPQKIILLVSTEATEVQMDSLRNVNPGSYQGSARQYSHIKVKYEDENGDIATTHQFISVKEKETDVNQAFSKEFVNKIKSLDSKSMKGINIAPATAKEMDSLKANHSTVADFDPNANYRKIILTYIDEEGKTKQKVDFTKEQGGVNPTNVNTNLLEIEKNQARSLAQDTVKESKVFNLTDLQQQPEFPGGMGSFYNTINKNFKIPEVNVDMTAKIYVSFIVEKDGSLSNIKCLRDPGKGLGDEAVRVLKAITEKWKPGIVDGKPVRASYNLPITINIQS